MDQGFGCHKTRGTGALKCQSFVERDLARIITNDAYCLCRSRHRDQSENGPEVRQVQNREF